MLKETEGASLPNQARLVTEAARGAGTKTAIALIEWLSHLVVVAALLAGMKALQVFSRWLWEGKDVHLGLLTIDELLKTADFILVGAVLILGIGCVVRAYRG